MTYEVFYSRKSEHYILQPISYKAPKQFPVLEPLLNFRTMCIIIEDCFTKDCPNY